MNNKIIIAVVAVVVVGAGAWYLTTRSGGVVMPGQIINNSQTMAALIAAGRPVKCTVTPSEENGNMTGTFYIANGKTRGDFTSTIEGRYNGGHMIIDGRTSYTWFDGQTSGFKITAHDVEVSPGQEQPLPPTQGFNAEQEMGFACEAWSVDSSKFTVPSQINFVDMTAPSLEPEPTNGSAGAGASANGSVGANVNAGAAAGGTTVDCSACDQVPAEYRVQCRNSLGCN